MKAKEFIKESITFNPAKLVPYGKEGKQAWSNEWGEYVNEPCWVCDGTGLEQGKYTCGMCDGKKVNREWKSHAPELNVSNANARAVTDMLGVDYDYSGVIENKDLPTVMRKLLLLKNKGAEQFTEPGTKSGGQMRKYTDDSGNSAIGRSATMYDMGRTSEQVNRYIDSLIAMVKFAQENGGGISWG